MTILSTLEFPSGRQLEKISLIKESPALSFYSAEEHITEIADEFGSPNVHIRPVWLAICNQTDEKSLKIWKDWSHNVKDYFGVECKEAAIINNRLAAVLSLFDDAQLLDKFPDSKGKSFISALCDMALRLDNLGFDYKYWDWSNIVQVGDCWKLLPSPSMERTSEPNVQQTLARLGKWLMGIRSPFLQTQPARSIIEIIASGQIPDEIQEEIIYEGFWNSSQQGEKPLQLNLTQNQNSIRLEWDVSLNEEVILLQTDGKKKAYPGQFIWYDNIEQYGTPLSNVSGINPVIDSDAGTAQWNRPQDNSRYQTLTITPAVRRDNWFEWGIPVVVGGPEEANLLGAYFDNDSNEIVLTPSWSDDRSITKIYVVIRQDRFPQNVNDYHQGIPPVVIERRLVNHPFRKKIRFSSQLFIVIFNAVTIGNKVYFSAGQAESCRKIVCACR